MGIFEEYLNSLPQSINLIDFLLNLAVTATLCLALRYFYIRLASAVSNRLRFANNFLPLGLTTVMVITIINFSPLLSLGLVGALSIVRYRAAIKDPEELTYLFLVIGIGLAAGANQPLVALIGFLAILTVLFLTKRIMGSQGHLHQENRMYLSIRTDIDDLTRITNLLTEKLPFVELKRMDKRSELLDLSYLIQATALDELESVKQSLTALSPGTTFSLVDQPELVV